MQVVVAKIKTTRGEAAREDTYSDMSTLLEVTLYL
jgi:hypothetical protein